MKIIVAVCMLFANYGMGLCAIHADGGAVIPDGTYPVPVAMMNAQSPTQPSMAAGALSTNGTLEVNDGKWALVVEFKTLELNFGGATAYGNASDIKYYEGALGTPEKDAEIVSYRNDATVMKDATTLLHNQKAVAKVRIPVDTNRDRVFISMYVDAMKMTPDALITFDLSKGLKNDFQNAVTAAKAMDATEYTPASYATLQSAITNAEANASSADTASVAIALQTLQKAVATLAKVAPAPATDPDPAKPATDPKQIDATSRFETDGTYTVNIALWNASKDAPSMAASAIEPSATILVKDHKAVMYMKTKPMTLGTITASLQEMKVGPDQEPATVVDKDSDGNPTMFSFTLPSEADMIDVEVNPHVAVMGNTFIPARIKIDYASLTKVSDELVPPTTQAADPSAATSTIATQSDPSSKTTTPAKASTSVQTGDDSNMGVLATTLVSSLGVVFALFRKRIWH